VDFVCVATIVSQNAGDFTEIFVEGDGVRFPIVPCLDGGERFGVGFNEGGKPQQEVASSGSRKVAPGRCFKGRSSGCDGDVNVFGCSGVDGCDFGLITLRRVLAWIYAGEGWGRGGGTWGL